jgi:hypothetical protein
MNGSPVLRTPTDSRQERRRGHELIRTSAHDCTGIYGSEGLRMATQGQPRYTLGAQCSGEVPVMAGPGDEVAAGAGDRGHLRASHADREQVIDTLKAAFVQGMLAEDEFDLRVGQTFASRTHAELVAVTVDLPADLTAAQPPQPAPAQREAPVLRPRSVIAGATALYAGMWPLAVVLPRNGDGYPLYGVNLLGAATLVYLLVLISAFVWAQALGSRREERSGGQLPGRPAPGSGQAPRRLPSADPGRQLPPGDHGHRHAAEATRRRRPRPPLPVRGHCAGGALAAGPAPASG